MMDYEIIATSVTSGLVQRLGALFPGVTLYREVVPAQSLRYPHFFAHQLTVDTVDELRNRKDVNYLVTVRYHHVADPVTQFAGLQEQLDSVGIKLLSELQTIDWGGVTVTFSTPRIEKVDGVLHWFANLSVKAYQKTQSDALQQNLAIQITEI